MFYFHRLPCLFLRQLPPYFLFRHWTAQQDYELQAKVSSQLHVLLLA